MTTLDEYVLSLIYAAIHNESVPSKPVNISWTDLFRFAQKHKIESICYLSMARKEKSDDPTMKEWAKAYSVNLCQCLAQEKEKKRLEIALNKYNIAFLPMKGWFLRSLYSREEFRFMSDLDILVRREDRRKAKQVMRELGYTSGKEINYDESFYLPPFLHVELHYDVVGIDQETWYGYYKSIWNRAILVEKTEYCLSPEDFYIHMTVNFAKDYFSKGAGLRSVLDYYYFLYKFEKDLDWNYIRHELTKLDLVEIENQVRELSFYWFNKRNLEYSSPMSEKLLLDGVNGNRNNFTENYYKKKTRNIKCRFLRKPMYIVNRAFPGYKEMCYSYPILRKIPILMPYFWCRRLIIKRKSIPKVWRAVRKIND